jgi:hypothetical protein
VLQTTPLETRIGPSHRCVALVWFASKSDKKRSLQKGTYFSRKIDNSEDWDSDPKIPESGTHCLRSGCPALRLIRDLPQLADAERDLVSGESISTARVVLAVVLGGIGLSGGKGSISNVVVGTALIVIIVNGMTVMGPFNQR